MVFAPAGVAANRTATAIVNFFIFVCPRIVVFCGTISSGPGAGKRGGARLESVGHFQHHFLKSLTCHAMQQPVLEFELDGEIDLATLAFGREAPMVFQSLERAFY